MWCTTNYRWCIVISCYCLPLHTYVQNVLLVHMSSKGLLISTQEIKIYILKHVDVNINDHVYKFLYSI